MNIFRHVRSSVFQLFHRIMQIDFLSSFKYISNYWNNFWAFTEYHMQKEWSEVCYGRWKLFHHELLWRPLTNMIHHSRDSLIVECSSSRNQSCFPVLCWIYYECLIFDLSDSKAIQSSKEFGNYHLLSAIETIEYWRNRKIYFQKLPKKIGKNKNQSHSLKRNVSNEIFSVAIVRGYKLEYSKIYYRSLVLAF